MLEMYMTEDSAWSGSGPYTAELRRRKRRGGLFVSEMRFPWGQQQEEEASKLS